jgi:hypothetical protein
MTERGFAPSGEGVAKLIFGYLKELYPGLDFSFDTICDLVVPTEHRGADVKFLAGKFANNFGIDLNDLMHELYQKLVRENEKGWFDRAFYGMLKGDDVIRFRLVDDSTT